MEINPELYQKIKNWFLIPGFILILLLAGYAGAIPFFRQPDISVSKKILGLEDPLVISFSRSVVHHKIESTFSLDPKAVGNISWRGKDLVFTPVEPWEPGKNYGINFKGMTQATVGFSFEDKFSTEALPGIERHTPEAGALVGTGSPIEFFLDKGDENFHLDFKITPSFNYNLLIDQERKYFQINPVEPLVQDTNYQIIAYETYLSKDKKDWYPLEIANFQFKTLPPPEIQKMIPGDKTSDVAEFEPIKAYFSKPMKVLDWQNFIEITPSVKGQVQWEDEEKTLIFKPFRWAQDTNYTVKIKKGWQANDNSSLNKDFLVSFHSFNSSGMVGKLSAASQEAKIKEGKYVDINLSKQLLTIFADGTNMGNYRVSSGKKGMSTPTGTFNVLMKQKKRWSKEYHLFMPYWMQFTRAGHGIHELPEWPNGYKEGANHLGTPVSHGCVRLGVGAAKTVYGFVDVGTQVYIHY